MPDDQQQLQEIPELSPKHWMDFSEEGKRQTVTEMKKCDVLYNEELKKFRCVYIYINCIYTFLPHPCTCTIFLFKRDQYLECLLKKIGRQMDAHGKDHIDNNMFNISKSSASERCGWFILLNALN